MCVINDNIMKNSANVGDDKLTILHQGKSFTFDVALELLYFYRSGHLVYLVVLDGTEYPIRQSLTVLIKRFTPYNFIQLNRSVVFNFNFVQGYTSGTRRNTLELNFKPSIQKIITAMVKTFFTVTREHMSIVRDQFNVE